jgi:hypothetical protein
MTQARFEAPQLANNHLTLGVQTMWQDSTQVNYFGIGSNSIDDDQSQYQLRTLDVVGYAAVRPHDWLTYSGEVGWLHRPNVLAPGGTFKPGFPDTSEAFPNDPGTTLPFQNFLHGEAAVRRITALPKPPDEGWTLSRSADDYSIKAPGLQFQR